MNKAPQRESVLGKEHPDLLEGSLKPVTFDSVLATKRAADLSRKVRELEEQNRTLEVKVRTLSELLVKQMLDNATLKERADEAKEVQAA